jgi:hypothetical protein
MNSHIPSLAMIMNLSSGVSLCSTISGSGITPTDAAHVSPMALDIANPGSFYTELRTHTLAGPISSFKLSLYAETFPPQASIRHFSSRLSGLWSKDSGTADQPPILFYRPITARESPTFPHVTKSPRTTTYTQVLPENYTSILDLSSKSLFTLNAPENMASFIIEALCYPTSFVHYKDLGIFFAM